jgi:hypothetical protein
MQPECARASKERKSAGDRADYDGKRTAFPMHGFGSFLQTVPPNYNLMDQLSMEVGFMGACC